MKTKLAIIVVSSAILGKHKPDYSRKNNSQSGRVQRASSCYRVHGKAFEWPITVGFSLKSNGREKPQARCSGSSGERKQEEAAASQLGKREKIDRREIPPRINPLLPPLATTPSPARPGLQQARQQKLSLPFLLPRTTIVADTIDFGRGCGRAGNHRHSHVTGCVGKKAVRSILKQHCRPSKFISSGGGSSSPHNYSRPLL